MKYGLSVISLVVVLFLTACGGNSEEAPTQQQQEQQQQEEQQQAQEQSTDASVAEITIESNDMMKFNTSILEVTEGQTVKLTLKHVGEMEKKAMGHNWVLLKKGVDKDTFAGAAIAAADNDYIPADRMDDIIAHTKMLGGGESDTIEFEAPAVGDYQFLCTFPGHVALMNGSLVVKAATE